MPVLMIYGIPQRIDEHLLMVLSATLSHVVCDFLSLKPNDMSVFFPADRLDYDRGRELICFVEGLFEKLERDHQIRKNLAKKIAETLKMFSKEYLPECRPVEVFIKRFDQVLDGFYSMN